MNIQSSEYFSYRNNKFYCEEVPVSEILKKTGTPLYLYSKSFFKDRYQEFTSAFASINHSIYYAVKSNSNLSVIKTFLDLGSGIDVNSEGEFFKGIKAGAKPGNVILTGVGKTEDEIRLGIEKDVLMIKAESEEEIYLINRISEQVGKKAKVAIRVNPDVNPQTHPYISTGLAENKFGVDRLLAEKLFTLDRDLPNIEFKGIDMHLGSQIISVDPYIEAVRKMHEFYSCLLEKGIKLSHFDLGGGMGIRYNHEDVFSISELADAIIPELKKFKCKMIFEPGRYLTANGGVLVTKVLYTKKNQVKDFLVTDAAVNDLLRPSFYGAYHHIQPLEIKAERKDIVVDVVGPVCESGDFLAKNRTISKTETNEFLAIMSAGSYGMVMSSNYNARRRAAEVMVDKDKYYTIRSRETLDHLIYDEELLLKNNAS